MNRTENSENIRKFVKVMYTKLYSPFFLKHGVESMKEHAKLANINALKLKNVVYRQVSMFEILVVFAGIVAFAHCSIMSSPYSETQPHRVP